MKDSIFTRFRDQDKDTRIRKTPPENTVETAGQDCSLFTVCLFCLLSVGVSARIFANSFPSVLPGVSIFLNIITSLISGSHGNIQVEAGNTCNLRVIDLARKMSETNMVRLLHAPPPESSSTYGRYLMDSSHVLCTLVEYIL